eukprot:1530071-Rhodomonas_salina.1
MTRRVQGFSTASSSPESCSPRRQSTTSSSKRIAFAACLCGMLKHAFVGNAAFCSAARMVFWMSARCSSQVMSCATLKLAASLKPDFAKS